MKNRVFAGTVVLMFFGVAPMLWGQAAGRHKVQVTDRALGQTLAASGARLIADYGGFQLFDAPDSMTNLPAEQGQLRDDYNIIHLNASRLDTTSAKARSLRKPLGAFAGKRLHLVQFAGPVQPEWRQALLDAGAQIASYIPQNTYLVYGDSAALARVQAQAAAAPRFQWEGAYADEYKIQPSGKSVPAKTDQFAIQLMADDAANAETLKLIDQFKLAPISRQRSVLTYVDIVVRVNPAHLSEIAARPDVVSIQPYATPRLLCERQDQIVAGNLSGNMPSGPGYLAWLQSRGFNQSQFGSFCVDISDGGIDNGTTLPNHFGLYKGGIIASTNSRVVYNRLEGAPNPGSTLAGCDGHGNINAHIVGGFDNKSGFPFADSSGFHYGLGVCPYVSLGSSVLFDPTNWTSPSYEDLMSQAYEDGARVSNNSWGDPEEDGNYNLDSQEYDALVRDAQPAGSKFPAAGNQEMIIVFAAGNEGQFGSSTINPPATGKNVLVVGAAENVQKFGGAAGGSDFGGVTDDQSDDANAIADFSSVGPCTDGRQKPDLVAPGTHVSGGAPQAANPGPDGTALLCFRDNTTNTIEVDGGSDKSFFFPDTGQQFYTASSGTSHSTPCVSGGCALLRQYFINQSWTPPSPALTKAWLINATRYMTGALANDNLWSPEQGMGEMNLGMALDGVPRLLRDEAAGDMFTATGQARVFNGFIADSSKPFRVTIAWTDAPGSTTGASYNNDLDLTVRVGGRTYFGNVFNGAYSISGGTADPYDNVESVFLPAGISGGFTVTITAASINSLGVPGAAGVVNQDFALVVYNAGPAPVLAAGAAVLTHEMCVPTNGTINPGEVVTVNLPIQNAGAASTTNLTASLLAGNGIALPSGPQSYGALAPGATGTASYSFQARGACGDAITAVLQLQDGPVNLGTVTYNFQLGELVTITNFSEDFDQVTPPSLPNGWTTSDTARAGVKWTTVSAKTYSAPHSVYCPDSDSIDEVYLTSPFITLPNGPCQLTFQGNFNLENMYDGGVLRISIGGGGFQDILDAGGSFLDGSYVQVISNEDVDCEGPLTGLNTWSGASDGFLNTVVNLPPSAQGQTIQLQWAAGTDCINETLVGVGGWWIDNIAIVQTNWACCVSAASAAPKILSPGGEFQSTTPIVTIGGTAAANAILTLYDNGVSIETLAADSSGQVAAQVTLAGGANVLVLTENGTAKASAPVTNYFLPAPPSVRAAAASGPSVSVSGSGLAGAIVDIFANGALAAAFTNDASGLYSGTIDLSPGGYQLTGTETSGGLASFPSAAVSVTVVSVPAPAILSPGSGLLTNNASLIVKGTGIAGAPVSVYDNGASLLGTIAASNSGAFSLAVKLSGGANLLTATQFSGGVNSPASAAILVTVALKPIINPQPSSVIGFLKEKVAFSSGAYGTPPLHYFWEKNGVKIPGAITTNLTLASLAASSAGSYALVASNAFGATTSSVAGLVLVANPFANLTGTYYGLFAETPGRFASSGYLQLTLGSLGAFSGSIRNAGNSYSFTGAFSVEGAARAASGPLSVNMNLDLTANNTEEITGTVSSASWAAPLRAGRAVFGPGNVFPNAGKYTMTFENFSDGSFNPGGDGYGAVTLSPAGMASWSGALADNTLVTAPAVGISKAGEWPIYVPLYGKLGSLSGWVTVTNAGFFSGEAHWFRVGPSGKLYPSGFTNALAIAGSAFKPGSAKVPALNSTNLVLTLSGGGLGANLSCGLTLLNSGKLATNSPGVSKLVLSVAPSTGVISGTFLDPETRLAATIKGVVLQSQDSAFGFFVSANATGSMNLNP
ncbi:MAG TPA: S8 family serine peptidase [Verrucomicrobiae bacterium]